MKFELRHQFSLESARFLPRLPEGHPCRKMHGHSFKVFVTVEGPLDPKLGWMIDFHDLQVIVKKVIGPLDHAVLNEHLENPTTENLCAYVAERLKPLLPGLKRLAISETPETECSVSY
jgi:6-pyruvoyltetrahydropterin/6-carboxytetrahydropterin synthase